MKQVLKIKYSLLILLLTTIATFHSELSKVINQTILNLFPTAPTIVSGKILPVITKVFSISTLFGMFSYMYDNYIWKWIFSKYNISGKWSYTNSYLDKRQNTTGTIIVKQTPYSIKLIDGLNNLNNKYPSKFTSTSERFDELNGKLYCSYEVYKYKPDDMSKFVTKKSILQLSVSKRKDSWLSKRPIEMHGEFFNCLQPSDEIEKLSAYELGDWPMSIGNAYYTLI